MLVLLTINCFKALVRKKRTKKRLPSADRGVEFTAIPGRKTVIEVHIGTTVFKCSTPEEAARVHQLVNGGGQGTVAHPTQALSVGRPIVSATPERNDRARAFLKKLETVVGQELDIPAMVKLTGVKNLNGIGPRLAQFRKSLQVDNIVLDDFIEKMKPELPGPTHWLVRKQRQEKMA